MPAHLRHLDVDARCARAVTGADDFTLPGARPQYPPDVQIEPVHVDINLRVDLQAAALAGQVVHTVVGRGEDPRTLTLHGVGFDGVRVDAMDGRRLSWTYDGQEITVTWDEPVARGAERRFAVRYTVTEPPAGLYFSRPSDAYPDDPWYAATDHETERARFWLPTVDLPAVRPRLDFHITAADRLTTLANGRLVGEDVHDDGTKTVHWRMDQPCPSYLTCFVVGDLVRVDDRSHGDVPVAYFAPTGHATDDLLRSFGRTPAMLEWITELLDRPFPFSKYYQFALPGFTGAMENSSLVSWNDLYVLDETLAQEWGHVIDGVNVHELAHSYFGDAVVVRDFAHAWLKESWATYIETVWWEHQVGTDEALYDYYANALSYFEEADKRYRRPIVTRTFNSSWQMYDKHLYPGGACRLHMLRRLLGDGPFWAGVRDYVATYEGRVVETDDFRRVMESHSGRSLVEWFDQWLHTPGYPHLKVSFKYDAEKAEGVFSIAQKQVDEEQGVAPFRFDLDLGWVIGGTLSTTAVRVRAANHSFAVAMDGEPEQVRVDPGAKVLHKLDFDPGDARLRAQLTEAEDVIGRIQAGRVLARSGRRGAVSAVADAYRHEPHWGARLQLGRALAEARSHESASEVARLVAWEHEPRVLAPLIHAAASLRDPEIREAIRSRLEAGLPYLAARAAYVALGAQRDDAPFDLLVDAANRDSPAGLAQGGALLGLGGSRRPEALDVLRERTRYGTTAHKARHSAATAVGALGRYLDDRGRARAREALEDLLRDPEPTMRGATVSALAALGDRAAIPALEAYRAGRPRQEQVAVDRAVRKIRAAQEPRRATDDSLDDLKADVRRMGERLDRLATRLEALGGNAEEPPADASARAEKAKEKKPKKKRGKQDAKRRKGK